MNNFTKGPWEIKNGGDIFGPLGGDSGDGLAADHNDGWQVAEVDSYVTFVEGELTELGYDVRRANMELITTAGTAATRLADMDIDAVKCIEMLPEIVEAIADIRASDCGGWLKDCGTRTFTCADGRAKRHELMRLLDNLYRAGCTDATTVADK